VPKTTKTTKLASSKTTNSSPAYRLRRSPVHGSGLFATRNIPKGAHVIEYVGERISHAEADRRHADKDPNDGHTFLFTIDSKTVIDAAVGGNDSRFINHSCDPNCEVVLDDGRPMVEAIKDIEPGEELAYDYNLTRDDDDSPEIAKVFACRCGTAKCRGTMLAPPKKKKPKKKVAASKKKAPTNKKAQKPASKKSPPQRRRAAA
jgi:SET domain-containing protein